MSNTFSFDESCDRWNRDEAIRLRHLAEDSVAEPPEKPKPPVTPPPQTSPGIPIAPGVPDNETNPKPTAPTSEGN